MAISVADNFSYQGGKPLDARMKFSSVSDMVNTPAASLYDGCFAYVTAEKKYYSYDSSNTEDPTLGKWTEYSSGGGGSSYTAGDGIDITNDVISTKQSETGDMDEIVDVLPTGGHITVSGYTPLGTILPYFGETVPKFYLKCDGATYNKLDYPELANHLLSLTNHSQYEVSGDDTKFKVPDLRGEFLRGTGTNGHADQGNGANVGVHQDATYVGRLATSGNSAVVYKQASDWAGNINADSSKKGTSYLITNALTATTMSEQAVEVATRPTNTSVLWCIAYKDIYTNPMNNYSTDEKVVGTWIDGKPLYQKTIDCGALPNNSTKNVSTGFNSGQIRIRDARLYAHRSSDGYTFILPVTTCDSGAVNTQISFNIQYDGRVITLITGLDRSNITECYATIQYTKTTD